MESVGGRRRVLVLLFVVAAISAAWQILSFPGPGFGRFWETVAVARNLAAGHGFANPYGVLETGPTAHLAPLFPTMLAGLIRVFGDGQGFGLAAIALCILAHALYCVLFVPLSLLLFGDRRPGLWAGLFSAAVPTIQMLPQWDAIYAAVAAQLFCLASARWMRFRLGPFAAGASCGALLLLNPALVMIAGAWMVFLRPPPRAWCAFALAAGLVCLPWTIRNYRMFGALFFIRDDLGAELYMSNADCADARDAVNQQNGCHILLQPNLSMGEAQAIRDQGEIAYNRGRMAAARHWMEDHPARFLRLTLRRAREFWFPTAEGVPVYEYSRWVVTLLSLPGLVLLIRERNRAAIFLAGSMVVYPLLYYLIQASTRYRSPVLWVSVLPAAYAVWRGIGARSRGGLSRAAGDGRSQAAPQAGR